MQEFVEKGILEGAELDAYLREVFEAADAGHCDAVVLGCTHFPLLKGASLINARRRLYGASGAAELLQDHVIDLSLCGHIHHP